MFRLLIAAAAVAVGAWALLRKKGLLHGHPRTTRTTIVIGGSASHPVITREPTTLNAHRGEELIWDVRNETNAPQEISLRNFKRRGEPPPGPPLEKSDDQRKVRVDQTAELRDRVRGNAKGGTYKYDIHLNGQVAVDPDVVIWEEGGG